MWGLSEQKSKVMPPKNFNIASRLQKTSIEQPLSTRVHPVAVLKILDAYVRRPESADRIIGTLLGWISEGSVVDITDCFPVLHRDGDDQAFLNKDYHVQMLALKEKVSSREVVVGWFATGAEINPLSANIHKYYCSKESGFNATAVLPGPVHLLVDTTLSGQAFGMKAYVNVRTLAAENLLQFHEVPLRVQTSAAEKSGISQLMQARRANRDTPAGQNVKGINTLDGFEAGLKELLGLFKRMQEYVRAVQAGKVEGDLQVGRGLTQALCSEPVIDINAVEQLCNSSLQDALMVVYLSNLTRTQVAIAEKINAQLNTDKDS